MIRYSTHMRGPRLRVTASMFEVAEVAALPRLEIPYFIVLFFFIAFRMNRPHELDSEFHSCGTFHGEIRGEFLRSTCNQGPERNEAQTESAVSPDSESQHGILLGNRSTALQANLQQNKPSAVLRTSFLGPGFVLASPRVGCSCVVVAHSRQRRSPSINTAPLVP